jgi:serine phosphatase RsbU (regulator of sigma subunit)
MRERRSVLASNIRSVLSAPLVHANKKLGVLYIDSQVTQAIFGDTELGLLRSFAAHAAVAMNNASQFSTIQEMNRDLDAKVKERTREVEGAYLKLEDSMELLKNTTLRLAEAEREAFEKELQVARKIQMAMVPPRDLFELPGAKLSGFVEPASHCGGDLWSFADMGDGRSVLLVGDVTGHGAGAAMITTVAKSCMDTLHLEHSAELSLVGLLRTMNQVVRSVAKGELMMTAFVLEIDRNTKKLRYVSAGHNPQYLVGSGAPKRKLKALHSRGTRLGDTFEEVFDLKEVEYTPGDRVVLYTDGIIECTDPAGKEYGMRRFRRALQKLSDESPDVIVDGIKEAAWSFFDGEPPEDDITLVIAELT